MSAKGKIFTAVGIIILIALIVWTVRTIPTAPAPVADDGKKVMTYSGNTLSEEKDGKKLWDLTADDISVDINTQDTTLTNITGHFYAKDGKVAEIKAPHAIYEQKSKNVVIDGGVTITNSDGTKLESKSLEWKAKEELLSAVDDVKFTKDDVKGSGDRIDSTDAFNKIKIIGHAHIEKGGSNN